MTLISNLPANGCVEVARVIDRNGNKEPRRKQWGIFGWPGYATRACVARVRERGIASAQEVTGI